MLKRLSIAIIFLLAVSFVIIGCQGEDDSGAGEIEVEVGNGIEQGSEAGENGSLRDGADDSLNDGETLNEDALGEGRSGERIVTDWAQVEPGEILALASGAITIVYDLMNLELDGELVQIGGNDCYYLPEPYETRGDIKKQLSPYLTDDGIERTMAFMPIFEDNGKMARLDVPGDKMPDVINSKIEIESATELAAGYLLTIPLEDDSSAYLGITVVNENNRLLIDAIDFRKSAAPGGC